MKKFVYLIMILLPATSFAQVNKESNYEFEYIDSVTVSKYKTVIYPDTSNIYSLKCKHSYFAEDINYNNIYYEINDKVNIYNEEGGGVIINVKQMINFWVWNLPSFLRYRKCNYILKGRVFYSQPDESLKGHAMLITEIRLK